MFVDGRLVLLGTKHDTTRCPNPTASVNALTQAFAEVFGLFELPLPSLSNNSIRALWLSVCPDETRPNITPATNRPSGAAPARRSPAQYAYL